METTDDCHSMPFLELKTSASLVIEEWCTSSIYGLTAAMLAAIIAAVSYECLDEYLRHIRHRAISSRERAPTCCDQPTFTCGQKVAQSILQMLRIGLGYFMMLCVMTMNLWLLASVAVGAAVGYGAFKPLLANSISDAVVTHGYDVAQVSISKRSTNRSQRSTSWRYRTVSQEPYLDVTLNDDEPVFNESAVNSSTGAKSITKCDSGTEVVWILKSDLDTKNTATRSPQHERVISGRSPNRSDNVVFRQENSPASDAGSPSPGRFKSTSRIISKQNKSLDRSDSVLTSRASVTSISVTSLGSRVSSAGHRKPAHRSASTSSGRFRSVSRQISRHQSFNSDNILGES